MLKKICLASQGGISRLLASKCSFTSEGVNATAMYQLYIYTEHQYKLSHKHCYCNMSLNVASYFGRKRRAARLKRQSCRKGRTLMHSPAAPP